MKHVVVVIAVVACVGLAGCGKEESSPTAPTPTSVSVKYKVESPYSAGVTYATAGGGTSQQARAISPWQYTFTAKTGDFLYLSAQNDSSSGCVFVTIYVNDAIFKSGSSCGAYVIATVSGTA
jgi:hypothetical protein